jgi:hypothetical protein
MSAPILFAQVFSIMNVLKQNPPTTSLDGTGYKFSDKFVEGENSRPTVVGSMIQANGYRVRIQDETQVAETLARVAIAAQKVGKTLRCHFTKELNAAGKQVIVNDTSRPYYTLAPAQAGGFWLDTRLAVPKISI